MATSHGSPIKTPLQKQLVNDILWKENKITEEFIKEQILRETYMQVTDKTVICVIELKNGFEVHGIASVVDVANFEWDVGKEIAYKDAIEKCWGFFGFMLQDLQYLKEQ